MDFREKIIVEIGLDLFGSGQEPVAGCNEYGNEPPDTRKGGISYLPVEYFLLKKHWVLLSLFSSKEGNIVSIRYKQVPTLSEFTLGTFECSWLACFLTLLLQCIVTHCPHFVSLVIYEISRLFVSCFAVGTKCVRNLYRHLL
jgi:hypothetical protein